MAKKSVIAREHKRARMAAKYADIRKKLKEAGDYEALDKVPHNASPVSQHIPDSVCSGCHKPPFFHPPLNSFSS